MLKKIKKDEIVAFKTYIPVQTRIIAFEDFAFANINRYLEEIILDLEKIDIPIFSIGIKPRLELIKPSNVDANIITIPKKSSCFKYRIIKMELEVPKKQLSLLIEGNSEVDFAYHIDCFIDELINHIQNLFLACNIAYFGLIRNESGKVIAQYKKTNYIKTFPGMFNEIYLKYETSKKNGWPAAKKLSLKKTWDWLLKISDYFDGVPNSNIGRALAASSYLFNDHPSEVSPLWGSIWAIIGLESLYCDGNSGLTHQLKERVELFLGKNARNNKIISQIYRLRSKFVHGELNFPVRHTAYDSTEKYEKYCNETYDLEANAITILVATLQKMIEKDIYELQFKTILDI